MKCYPILKFAEKYDIFRDNRNQTFLMWGSNSDNTHGKQDWPWHELFDAPEYLQSYIREGHSFEYVQILEIKCSMLHDEIKKRNTLENLIKKNGISDTGTITDNISRVEIIRKPILDQLKRGLEALELIDLDIQNVLKVLYAEIFTTADDDLELEQAKGLIRHIYKYMVRSICDSKKFQKQQMHAVLQNFNIDFIVQRSVRVGLMHFVKKKESILMPLIPIYETYHLSEEIKFLILQDLLGKKIAGGNPVHQAPRSQIIDLALKGLNRKNSVTAREFLNSYAQLKIDNPGQSPADYIRLIGMPEASEPTQRNWMQRYDKFEGMLFPAE